MHNPYLSNPRGEGNTGSTRGYDAKAALRASLAQRRPASTSLSAPPLSSQRAVPEVSEAPARVQRVRIHQPPRAPPAPKQRSSSSSSSLSSTREPRRKRDRARRAAPQRETVGSLMGSDSRFASPSSSSRPPGAAAKLTPARRKELCASCFELRVELERLRRRCAELESRGNATAAAATVLPTVEPLQHHVIKERALMQSVKALQLANNQLRREAKEHRRSRLIKRLAEQVKQQELVVDVLKQRVCEGGSAMKMSQVNDFLIKKTIGGPKRFRPQSREELEQAVVVLKGRVEHSKQSGRTAVVEAKQLKLIVTRLERDGATVAAAAAADAAARGDLVEQHSELQQKVVELSERLEDEHVRSRAKDAIIKRRGSELDELRSELERLDHANTASILAKAQLEEAQHALGRERETVKTLQQTLLKRNVKAAMTSATASRGSADQLDAVLRAHTEAREAERREHTAQQVRLWC